MSARHAAVIAALVVVATACGDAPAEDTTTTSSGSTSTSVAQSTTSTSGEVGLPDLVGDWDNGELFLQVTDDGSYQVLDSPDSDPNAPLMAGFVARDGTSVNFVTDLFGECAGTTGIYEVELSNSDLVLTLVDDPCQFRADRFPGPWGDAG